MATEVNDAAAVLPSKIMDLSPLDELPNNVSSREQLEFLPMECLSGDKERPLRHIEEDGTAYTFSLSPMTYSALFILLVEMLERFSFYGLNYTQTAYLTGAYDAHWNAGMNAVSASSYVSVSVAVAYTAPFLGAFLADFVLGEYWTMFLGCLGFYLPGLLLIAMTTVPGLLGDEFNRTALSIGLLLLWPMGTGIVKSIVNVFGAKQFHPLLQSSLIEAYYVNFYMCINIGAVVGIVLIPLLAQRDVTTAYLIPVCVLAAGVGLFAAGTSRYVRPKPKSSLFDRTKKAPVTLQGNRFSSMSSVFFISCLIIPFAITYSQMATTFIVQGTVMEKAFGFIDAPMMANVDALSVLFFGHVIGNKVFPALADRGIKIPTTYKFAIGSFLGACSIAWASLVEHEIHRQLELNDNTVSIVWQIPSYMLIAAGEIFAISAAYEVAFTAAPADMKNMASSVNLFCIGGIPNVICIMLYNVCQPWFENDQGSANITRLEDYATAHVGRYFGLLFLISLLGVFINLLPQIKGFVEDVEEQALEQIKTPKTPIRPMRRDPDDEDAFLRTKRHHAYLKYGSGPALYKHGSMRAGASIGKGNAEKKLRRTELLSLYRSDPVLPSASTTSTSTTGNPSSKSERTPLVRSFSGTK